MSAGDGEPGAFDVTGLNRYDDSVGDPPAPFDPLRLCVYTTVALIACVLGPLAVAAFAGVAIAGYSKARRAGLLRSRCKLGDTRLVLAYLGVIALTGAVGIGWSVHAWLGG